MKEFKKPIGVFDSGLGGLTVVKALRERLPNESIVYLGDTARVPYGNKSKITIQKYSIQITEFLMRKNVKAIVVACNTVSALVLQALSQRVQIPVMGVIEPGVLAAENQSKIKRIGVIGTDATIQSNAYKNLLISINTQLKVFSQACPLLVPLAEDGWVGDNIVKQILIQYLTPLIKKSVDTLILGCTHYPVFLDLISEIIGPNVKIIDSPSEVANSFFQHLKKNNLLSDNKSLGKLECFVTDKTRSYSEIAEIFFGSHVSNLHFTDLI